MAPEDNCKSCDGLGRVRGRREVEIDLPAGVDDGFRIRKDGFGDVPMSGAGTPGALYVRINVAPSKIWRRQGTTLFYPAVIPFHTAILGGKVRVHTLDGAVEVRVPSGTQIGEEMLLQGRGVPSPTRRGQKGDLVVQFEVAMPRNLTKKQRELLQMYADEVEGKTAKPTPAPDAASSKSAETGAPKQAAPKEQTKTNEQTKKQPEPPKAKDQAKTDAESKTKASAKGRFTIHPSSRSDEQSAAAEGTMQSSAHAAADAASKAREDFESPPSSKKGVLGKAWNWMTGSSK